MRRLHYTLPAPVDVNGGKGGRGPSGAQSDDPKGGVEGGKVTGGNQTQSRMQHPMGKLDAAVTKRARKGNGRRKSYQNRGSLGGRNSMMQIGKNNSARGNPKNWDIWKKIIRAKLGTAGNKISEE